MMSALEARTLCTVCTVCSFLFTLQLLLQQLLPWLSEQWQCSCSLCRVPFALFASVYLLLD
jgi:hypothetical protein